MSNANRLESRYNRIISKIRPELELVNTLRQTYVGYLSEVENADFSLIDPEIIQVNIRSLLNANADQTEITYTQISAIRMTAVFVIATAKDRLMDRFNNIVDGYCTRSDKYIKKNMLEVLVKAKSREEISQTRATYLGPFNYLENLPDTAALSSKEWKECVENCTSAYEALAKDAKQLAENISSWDKYYDDKTRLSAQKVAIWIAVASMILSGFVGAGTNLYRLLKDNELREQEARTTTSYNCVPTAKQKGWVCTQKKLVKPAT